RVVPVFEVCGIELHRAWRTDRGEKWVSPRDWQIVTDRLRFREYSCVIADLERDGDGARGRVTAEIALSHDIHAFPNTLAKPGFGRHGRAATRAATDSERHRSIERSCGPGEALRAACNPRHGGFEDDEIVGVESGWIQEQRSRPGAVWRLRPQSGRNRLIVGSTSGPVHRHASEHAARSSTAIRILDDVRMDEECQIGAHVSGIR